MNPEDRRRAEDLFHAARALPAGERAAFLDARCGGEAWLRREVESLLAHDESSPSFPSPLPEWVRRTDPMEPPSEEAFPFAGRRIGSFRTLGVLGSGGMGVVYRALDTSLGREVAIKLLSGNAAREERRVRRFAAEARAAAALNHPNILTIHAIGEEGGRPYLVSERVDGETVRGLLYSGPLSVPLALDVTLQVLAGLSRAHSAGIVHRDLKPENVMVRRDGLVKVLDFGVAKLMRDEGSSPGSREESLVSGGSTPAPDTSAATAPATPSASGPTGAGSLTEAGAIVGTVAYMSPEQARGEAVDARTDLFAVGVMLYEMLCGIHPFRRPSSTETLAALLREEPPPLDLSQVTTLSLELGAVLAKALRKDRSERYATAADMEADLRPLQQRLKAVGKAPAPSPVGVLAHALRSRRTWIAAGLTALLLAALLPSLVPDRGPIDSLAVLPLVNAGGDPEAEYLSDGITESLINSLSRVPELKVIARSSVFTYKGRQVEPRKVGRELGVKALLTGRVVQRGDSLALVVELVDARDSRHLWGEQYALRLAEVSAVQDRIARQISEQLRTQLAGEERSGPGRRSVGSTEAYQLYLKGRYHWNRRTNEAVRKGIAYFDEAIENDPTFALAYAGLADAYSILGFRRNLPPQDAWLKARAAARKALEIDESLAEAHTSLAFAAFNYDWDFPAAELAFRRALALNPGYAHAHHWYSHYLMAMGRRTESLEESRRALELDPLDLAINVHLAWHHVMAHEYPQAIEQCRRTLELDPNRQAAHLRLGEAYVGAGRLEEAIEAFRRSVALAPDSTESLAGLGHAYALAGRRDEASKVLDTLGALSKSGYVSGFDVALVHVGLGEKDRAFEWLGKAAQERATALVYLGADPRLDTLHPDLRFAGLLGQVGLEGVP